jgi:hypothetical protein
MRKNHRNWARGQGRKLSARQRRLKQEGSRKRNGDSQLDYQALEPRQVLNAAPIANDDLLYFTAINTAATGNLISNDFDAEGDSLSATLVGSAPSSGQLVLNSNGSFTFTPNTDFEGVASWTYKVSDGSLDSYVAKAQVLVGTGLSGATVRGLINSNNPLHTGAQTLVQDLGHEKKLLYRTDHQGSTIVQVETFAMLGSLTPTSITANLVLGGANRGTVSYSPTGFLSGPENRMRFAMQVDGLNTGTMAGR